MTTYFPEVNRIDYEGPDSENPLAFKHYNAEEEVAGRPMRDHLRFAICYWHTMKNPAADPFGPGTRIMPWEQAADGDPMTVAQQTLRANFEFVSKLGAPFWCFHDRDIAPEIEDDLTQTNRRLDKITALAKELQQETGVRLLWGTANLFTHPRFMSGAATSPYVDAFAHGAAQVKKALEVTHDLDGAGYVFWGGREGYDMLLNTDLKAEADHLAKLLHMAVDHKQKIGFEGQFYLEPKPREPTKHQYDYDAAACYAFLQKYDLADHFKLNIEANHATLAGHSFHHEVEYAAVNDMLGSIDANRGDTLVGWDTDQFPTDLYDTTLCMYTLLRHGGFNTGGLNFDAKLRRQSVDPIDLFHAHIGGMDAFARGLKNAAAIVDDQRIPEFIAERYGSWRSELGKQIETGQTSLDHLDQIAHQNNLTQVPSSRQEMLENLLNQFI